MSVPPSPIRSLPGLQVRACGSYVPPDVIDNYHLQERFGCDPHWIVRQTGVQERRHAQAHQATSDLAFEAARRCLRRADIPLEEVDLVLVATITPDMSFPSVACALQHRLGLNCPAVDLNAACAGFTYALITAGAYLAAGAYTNILVVGADCLSRIVDFRDMKTFPIMGDGAGAVLLSRGSPEQGIVRWNMGAHAQGSRSIRRPACGSRMPPTPEALARGDQFMKMDGRAVFQWAASILVDSVQEVVRSAGLAIADVDLLIPHQANLRILHAATDVLGIDRDKVVVNIDRYGNTSAASIPLALDEALQKNLISPGDNVILSGFGAGLVWSTVLFRW